MGTLIRLEDRRPEFAYKSHLKECGLRAWRLGTSLWLCVICQEGLTWFVSQKGQSRIISREVAHQFLAAR
jgi:hypothetical protein